MAWPVGETSVQLDAPAGLLDGVIRMPEKARAQCVLTHGAGAGIHHENMIGIAGALAAAGVASLRFNFPFMQAGRRRVDANAVAIQSIAYAVETVQAQSALPVLLVGHSFGGRMCSHAVAEAQAACCGLILCSFPLHPSKRPDNKRAEHLTRVRQPTLFLSGTRDDLALPSWLVPVVEGMPQARLHWLDTANHSYRVLKRTRALSLSVFEEMSLEMRRFIDELT